MSKPKPGKSWGKDVPIEDPSILRNALRLLRDQELEFPIKVEGTSTLPYTSMIRELRADEGTFVLKLVRPLPHELIKGAEFRMTFSAEDQRYEALITFQERAEYLSYLFSLPEALFYADRRTEKRFPFRPRESAYVTAQDGGIPGLGIAGPLVNVCLDGFAMRVDRILRLEDNLRIPPSTGVFDRGKSFARIRLQDLPKLPIFEASGFLAHASERGSEVILGFQFHRLNEIQVASLRESLSFREKLFKASPLGRSEGGAPMMRTSPAAPRTSPAAAAAPAAEAKRNEPPASREGATGAHDRVSLGATAPDPLQRMARRSARFLVVATDSVRPTLMGQLRQHGFHRLDVAPALKGVPALLKAGTPPVALLLDLKLPEAGAGDAMAAVRALEREVQALGTELPTILFAEQVDPTMMLAVDHRTRILPVVPLDAEERETWINTLELTIQRLQE